MLLFLTPTILALPPQDDVFRLDLLARKAGVQDRCIDYACMYTQHTYTPIASSSPLRIFSPLAQEKTLTRFTGHSFTPAKMCSHHDREQMHYVCWDIIHGGTGMFEETNELGKMLVDRVRKELRDLERWVHSEL